MSRSKNIPLYVLFAAVTDIGTSHIPEGDEGLATVGDSITCLFNVTNSGSVSLWLIEVISPMVRCVQTDPSRPRFALDVALLKLHVGIGFRLYFAGKGGYLIP